MDTQHMIESVYSGVPYAQAEKVKLSRGESPLPTFTSTRIPNDSNLFKEVKFSPYQITLEKYMEILGRVRLSQSECGELEEVFKEFSLTKSTLKEPRHLEGLLYPCDSGIYLTPNGVLAFLYRRSYGDQKFKQYINSTILKESYYKSGSKSSPPIYFWKDGGIGWEFLRDLGRMFSASDRWKRISNMMLETPYVYIWRD